MKPKLIFALLSLCVLWAPLRGAGGDAAAYGGPKRINKVIELLEAGQKAMASSPESASTWNSCEPVPPIEPVSAATARNCSPRRVKMRV